MTRDDRRQETAIRVMEVRSIETIVKTLNEAGVQYLIVGGLAVNAHGFVRLTRDVDLVMHLERENVMRGLQALSRVGYRLAVPAAPGDFADEATRNRWRLEKNMITLKLWSDEHQRTPIDIFVYEPFEFAHEMARASRLEVCPGVEAPVVSLETLLRMKREAGRPQDAIDIQELLRVR
jgi:predicted nucleotidyltransferase